MNVSLTSEMSILKNLNFRKKKIKNSDTKKLKKKSFKKFVCLPPSDKQLAIKFQFRAYARFS